MVDEARQQKMRDRTVGILASLVIVLIAAAAVLIVITPDEVQDVAPEDMTAAAPLPSAQPFYVLLIGSDSRKGTALYTGSAKDHAQVDQHSDIMTLVRVDPTAHQLTLVSVPRDTVLNGTTRKINDSLISGNPEETVGDVEELTGVHIDYYMMTTFTSYESIVDALGGVTADVHVTITVKDPLTAKDVTVKSGNNQLLDGAHALVLARARHEYGDNEEAVRQRNVRALETSIIQKVFSFDEDKARRALTVLQSNTTTNMSDQMVTSLVLDFAANKKSVVIYSCTGPYVGDYRATDGAWVVPEDSDTWSRLMDAVDAGDDPTGIVPLPTWPTD